MDQTVSGAAALRQELAGLMGQVVARDPAALKAVYERTSAKLYGICLRLLRDEAEAQDVLQEVYVAVWSKAASFDAGRASPITWLATLARNRAIDRLRSRRPEGEALDTALTIADDRPSALDVLEKMDDATQLYRCLETLDERGRELIREAFFEGATYPQLAERNGAPLPTVKSWVRRGLIRLRRCLEQ